MSSQRIFTVEEANAALPRLRLVIGQQVQRMEELERLAHRLKDTKREGRDVPPEVMADFERAQVLAKELDEGWREVDAMGVVVKDPRSGLCDFYGHVDGKLVWLCWRYGEETVAHYHELEAGFAGRKPLAGAPARARFN